MRSYIGIGLSTLCTVLAFVTLMFKWFFPYHRYVALAIYSLGWVLFALAFHHHRKSGFFAQEEKKAMRVVKHHLPFTITFIALLLFAYVAWILVPVDDLSFTKLEERELRTLILEDRKSLDHDVEGLRLTTAKLLEKKDVHLETLSPDERAEIIGLWREYLDYLIALDELKQTHSHFYQINYLTYPDLNAQSFLIGISAFSEQYTSVLDVTRAFDQNDFLITILNEKNDGADLIGGSYDLINQKTTSPDTLVQLNVGHIHTELLKRLHSYAADDAARISLTDDQLHSIFGKLGLSPQRFILNPFSSIERRTFALWFPIQMNAAEGAGDFRLRQRENFVTPAIIKAHEHLLRPGDILLERRNWFLSNIGLPGFWPHAALYVGTLQELNATFPGGTSGDGFLARLERENPAVYRAFEQSEEPLVLEAISEGVVLQPVTESMNGDYVAALRPRISRNDTEAALLVAFTQYGKPYDFNFDFLTDNELVCSELVYKTYSSRKGYRGLNLTLHPQAGRLVVTPNDIAQKFATEYNTTGQELDFIFFLDAIPEDNVAIARDAEALRRSYTRAKWTFSRG